MSEANLKEGDGEGGAAAPPGAPPALGATPASAAEEPEALYYTPPGAPLNGHLPAPRIKRFSRKMLGVVLAVCGAVVTLALAVGLRTPKMKAAAPVATPVAAPASNPRLNALPDHHGRGTYANEAQAKRDGTAPSGTPPTLPASSLGENQLAPATLSTTPPAPTPLEQYLAQRALEHLRAADRAQAAGVAFASTGAIAPTGAPSAAAGLEDRLMRLAERPAGLAGVPGARPSRREDPNGQGEKGTFAGATRDGEFSPPGRIQSPRSPYTVFAGTILPCVLTQGINSDLPGQIGCLIAENIYDTVSGRYLLIPQGTRAIGLYDSHVTYGQNRVLIVWTRLVRPDGSALFLEGMPGVDLSGYAGATGDVNYHYWRLLSGVVLGSVIGAGAQIAVGANSQNPGFAALALQGAGENINEAGQQITRKNLAIQPTIEIPPGARLNIFTTKDLILPPYPGARNR